MNDFSLFFGVFQAFYRLVWRSAQVSKMVLSLIFGSINIKALLPRIAWHRNANQIDPLATCSFMFEYVSQFISVFAIPWNSFSRRLPVFRRKLSIFARHKKKQQREIQWIYKIKSNSFNHKTFRRQMGTKKNKWNNFCKPMRKAKEWTYFRG